MESSYNPLPNQPTTSGNEKKKWSKAITMKKAFTLDEYVESADYDPCIEWLRLIVAIIAVSCAAGAVYPIKLGADCFLDNLHDGVISLSQCKKLFSIEYSMTVLVVSIVVEICMIILFFFTCRHEFCGVKRKARSSLPCSCCGNGRPSSAVVHPMTDNLPPAPAD